jgi:hypothetical protein
LPGTRYVCAINLRPLPKSSIATPSNESKIDVKDPVGGNEEDIFVGTKEEKKKLIRRPHWDLLPPVMIIYARFWI